MAGRAFAPSSVSERESVVPDQAGYYGRALRLGGGRTLRGYPETSAP